MRIRHMAVGTLVGTAIALGSAAAPAQATPGDSAPACVTRDVDLNPQGFSVHLENTCGSAVQVRIVVENAPGSACITLAAGSTSRWNSARGRYIRTVLC
ncbi:hypothetical protein [Embleya hyalina]|uniref:Alpha-amylase n=1 Tax=Embleya hyalina TaxID=516124 RepID=A0A401Z2B0_9ACTN|nr:hypothetical protein [Embleya hyalina]GCE00999.1 hypothetical protein EHYA_08738 [Embleya hyalina]